MSQAMLIIKEWVPIIVGSISVIVSAAITLSARIKQLKATETKNALAYLEAVHEFAVEAMIEVEKLTILPGVFKKQQVLAQAIIKFPKADLAELGDFIDKTIAMTKLVNPPKKEVK